MTAITKKQIGLIKTLQSKAGLDDADYRSLLKRITGRTSCTKLTTKQAAAVIRELGGGRTAPRRSDKAYVRKIHVLWGLLVKAGVVNRSGLNGFVARQTKIDNVEWLEPQDGFKVIEALKDWLDRAEVDYER